jgi:hypothetical protein
MHTRGARNCLFRIYRGAYDVALRWYQALVSSPHMLRSLRPRCDSFQNSSAKTVSTKADSNGALSAPPHPHYGVRQRHERLHCCPLSLPLTPVRETFPSKIIIMKIIIFKCDYLITICIMVLQIQYYFLKPQNLMYKSQIT